MTAAPRKIKHLYSLELLDGCRWNCRGCYVDKKNDGWNEGDADRFVKLCQEWEGQGDHLKDLVVGPTDFMTAKNTISVFEAPAMQSILRKFSELSLTTTFLDKNSETWAHRMNELLPKEILLRFSVVFDHHQFRSEKYVEQVKKNIDSFSNSFKGLLRITFVMPTVLENETDPVYMPRDIFEIRKMLKEVFNYEVGNGQGVSFARTGNFNFDKTRIVDHIRWLKKTFDTVAELDQNREIDFAMARFEPAQHYFFSYTCGKWFYNPYLYDELLIHDAAFQIPTEHWQAKEFTSFMDQLALRQFENIKGKPCDGCEYLGVCGQRNTIELIDRLGLNECLIPKIAMRHYGDRAWELRN